MVGERAAIRALAVAGALLFCGCASAYRPPPRPVEVKVPVPVPVPCHAPAPALPALPIATLKANSAPADAVRAYAATVAALKGAVRERDDLLAGCRGGGGETR